MSPRLLKIWLGTTLLLAVMLAPFLARGDQAVRQMKEHHARLIADLSDSQRNRLLQNEMQYRAATPAARQTLREFHAALEKDRLAGGELTSVMNQYDAWIKTIKRPQREQLASTSDPQERIELMKEIIQNEQESAARRRMPFFGPGGDRSHFEAPPLLDEKSLRAVMDALREAAQPRLSTEQQAELKELSGLKRDFRLLQILKEIGTGVNPKPLLEAPPREFKLVVGDLDHYVEDERILEFVRKRPGPADGEQASRTFSPDVRLAALVYQSMVIELFKLRRTAHQHVDETRLRNYLDSLPLDRQYELLSLEASDFQHELRNQYLDKEGLNDLPGLQDFRDLFGRGFLRGGMGNPDRGPPGFRGDRDNRPSRSR